MSNPNPVQPMQWDIRFVTRHFSYRDSEGYTHHVTDITPYFVLGYEVYQENGSVSAQSATAFARRDPVRPPHGSVTPETQKIISDTRHNISASQQIHFFIASNGQLSAMGRNNLGQLSVGTSVDAENPVPVLGIPAHMRIREIFLRPLAVLESDVTREGVRELQTASDSTHFLTEEGMVYAAGNNSDGQLGVGSAVKQILTAIPVMGLDGIVIHHIIKSPYQTYFLSNAGRVFGSGRSSGCQVAQSVPGIPNDAKIVKVFSHVGNSYFIAEDGRVFGKGHNGLGQLGVGDNDNRNVATQIIGLPVGARIVDIVSSSSKSYFVLEDGRIFISGNFQTVIPTPLLTLPKLPRVADLRITPVWKQSLLDTITNALPVRYRGVPRHSLKFTVTYHCIRTVLLRTALEQAKTRDDVLQILQHELEHYRPRRLQGVKTPLPDCVDHYTRNRLDQAFKQYAGSPPKGIRGYYALLKQLTLDVNAPRAESQEMVSLQTDLFVKTAPGTM
jgi:hypothetical protein